MQKKTSQGFTTVELLVTIGIVLILSLVLNDAINNAPYRVRTKSCQSNLTDIGKEVLSFRAAHNGKMPPSPTALLSNPTDKYIRLCPLTGAGYVYRYLRHPVSGDIICWDSASHKPNHNIFAFLNRANRNILTADGNVSIVSEEQFQAFHLQGMTMIVRP